MENYLDYMSKIQPSMEISFTEQLKFGLERICIIQRNGSTAKNPVLWIELPGLPDGYTYKKNLTSLLIDRVSVDLGGVRIDQFNGIINKLFADMENKQFDFYHDSDHVELSKKGFGIGIPIMFQYTKKILFAKYQDVRINVRLSKLEKIVDQEIDEDIVKNTSITNGSILMDYNMICREAAPQMFYDIVVQNTYFLPIEAKEDYPQLYELETKEIGIADCVFFYFADENGSIVDDVIIKSAVVQVNKYDFHPPMKDSIMRYNNWDKFGKRPKEHIYLINFGEIHGFTNKDTSFVVQLPVARTDLTCYVCFPQQVKKTISVR